MKKLYLAAALFFAVHAAYAGDISVSDAWARATAPGQDSATVALRITSKKDASLIAVSSPAANSAEIHSMTHEDGMMMMRALDALALKAGQEVVLGNDGNHLMLIGLKKPLSAGDSINLTLTVQYVDKHKEKITVKAAVKSLTENHEEHTHHHH